MRHILRYFLVTWILGILFIGHSPAQPVSEEIREIIKNAPSAQDYPQAGALILFDRLKLTVHPDGNTVSERHLLVKIFTDRGKENFGDIIYRYNGKAERAVVEVARTFKPDGTVVQCEKDAISDVSAPEVARASAYSNAMQKVVSFPAVEKGAVLEYKCKILPEKKKRGLLRKFRNLFFKDRHDKHFWRTVTFQGEEPILEKSFTLVLPQGKKFTYLVENGDIKPLIRHQGDNVVYTWKVNQVEQIIREPNMPNLAEIVPRLLLTSANSWAKVGDWLNRRFYPQVKTDSKLKKRVVELTTGKVTPEERIKEIFLYVTTKLRTVHLSLGAAGYKPNSSTEVYRNKYGDCRDKAVLLVAMLRAAGVQAYPTLVNHSRIRVVPQVPGPHQFDHLMVAVPQQDGSFLWLDPTAETCRYGYLPAEEQGTEALVLSPKGSRLIKTPVFTPQENGSRNRLEITLNKEGDIHGRLRCELRGHSDCRARSLLKDKTPKELKLYFESAASRVSQGAQLLDYSLSDLKDLTQPASIEIRFQCEKYAVVEGRVMLFEFPSVPFKFANIPISTDLPRRKYDILAPSEMEFSYNVEIKLPRGYKVSYLPPRTTIDNDIAVFSIDCEEDSGKTIFDGKLILKKRKVPSLEYVKVKSAFTQAGMPQNNLMILERL